MTRRSGAGLRSARGRVLLRVICILALAITAVVLPLEPAAVVLPLEPAEVMSDATCDRYASASGADDDAGSADAPYRTIDHLLSTLEPGETGCLLGGRFEEDVSIRTGGAVGEPITLTSAPGLRATVAGALWVADSADDVVITDLDLDGTNNGEAPSPQVNGDRVTFRGNDVTNGHRAICFVLGGSFPTYGRAVDVVLDGNRVHDCGRLPATNHDHGIYVEGADNARIVNNIISGNADWGIHLYPDADDSYVAHNVIDGNGKGLIFAGERSGGEYESAYASDRNLVELNVITNPSIGSTVESWWGGPVGIGNVARYNCLWDGQGSGLDLSGGGFISHDNLTVDPLYSDVVSGDYRLQASSPCGALAALS